MLERHVFNYKHPRRRQLVYYIVYAENTKEAIKKSPQELKEHFKGFVCYGYLGIKNA